MSAFQTFLYCHPWDLVDEGIEEALTRIRGETGIAGISVVTACPSIDQWRPHHVNGPRRFVSDGGVQFQPQAGCYTASRMRPVVAEWLRKSNPLATIAETCGRHGLVLRARHACCHSGVTVSRYPHAACKDAFGHIQRTWLCPVNLDVREMLRGCVEDLSTHYPLSAIELHSLGFPADPHTHHHPAVGVPLGPVGSWLASLCFCESCRQQAQRDHVDIGAALTVTVHALEGLLNGGEPAWPDVPALIAAEPALAALVEWRCRQVTELVALLRQSCRCRLVLSCDGDRAWTGMDLGALLPHVDAFAVDCFRAEATALPAELEAVIRRVGDRDRLELRLSMCTPPTGEAAALVASMKQAVDLGIRTALVENYGLVPQSRLAWLHQADRFARREAR